MRGRLRTPSLRARLMVLGVAGVALALAVGSGVLYGVLAIALNRTLDNQAVATAEAVATLVDQGQAPDPLPVSGAEVVQVVDAQNRVVTASVNADRLTALLRPEEVARARTGDRLTVSGSRAALSSPLRVVGIAAGPADDPVTVIVAQQMSDVLHSREVLRNTLLVTYPVLLAVLALIASHVIGRALRPVEALRSGAARISGAGQRERLPVPGAADEIHSLAVTLNEMLDRLDALRGRQRTFVADAAHELRSPLTSMRTQLEVAQHLDEGGSLPGVLLEDVARLSVLVEDLLLLARTDADDKPPSPPERMPAASLLEEVARQYDGGRVPVTVRGQAAGDSVTVSANREELRRALANLVDNAVRHAGSAVELSAGTEGNETVLTVTDDGAGIPEDDRDRVFERFTRLDDARARDAGGTGLGLAIVRELLSRNQGTVRLTVADPDVRGPSGQGLRAEIRLPH